MALASLRVSEFADRLSLARRRTFFERVWLWLLHLLGFLRGPSITTFEPAAGQPGTMVTIKGHRFSSVLEDNAVEVGGRPALVVQASATRLRVITAGNIATGPVRVTVDGRTATGPFDFTVLAPPNAGAGEDGPPISFAGEGQGQTGDVSPIGTIRVLVVLLRPSDRTPGAGERGVVQAAWNNVRTFYDQASYGRTDVQIDMTTNWAPLDGTEADFLDGDNIEWAQMERLTAQAAQAAVDEGFDLNDYAMMACVCSLSVFIRAWGGWSRQNFSYANAGAGIDIDITADHEINLLAIGQDADWGRCAHEFGHNVVSAPTATGDGTGTLGEDVYSSDLVDPDAASAQQFEMMGSHDTHPLFSGYHMEKLGYYEAANIETLTWDLNPFSQEFDIVAHGLTEDASARVHLVKLKVADGLFYYIQVRQRPGATAQIFDDSIPLGGAPNQGGVIVTRVISDTLNINQQTRFITLMHDEEVLETGDFVEDPARTIRITVVDGAIDPRPLVCRVRVEWAQAITDDPAGTFDLRVEPWDSNWQTPDIWVDRAPFGTFDQPNDSEGRPQGNGDRPRPNEINRLSGRIHVSGANGATNVKATFYAVFPPGVGDNGNWAPLGVKTIPTIAQNSFADVQQNWVPVVGEHTCLKLYAGAQLGEVSGGNNFAQENVFEFEAPASSPPEPVIIETAIRNPIDERRCILVSVTGVPFGWRVHFPHAWVWLDGKGEKRLQLTVIPMFDGSVYLPYGKRQEARLKPTANIRIQGDLPRAYDTPVEPAKEPAGSRAYPIGGILGRVHVRRRVDIRIEEDRKTEQTHGGDPKAAIGVHGVIQPALGDQRIRLVCTDPNGLDRLATARTDEEGRFDAIFDLNVAPTLEADRERWTRAEEIVPGVYRIRAQVVAATLAAEAESNELYVTRGLGAQSESLQLAGGGLRQSFDER